MEHGLDPHAPCQVLHAGYTVLVTREDGSLRGGRSREGLYDYDTRILSRHDLTVDGQPLVQAYGAVLASDLWVAATRLPLGGGSAAGPRLPQDQLAVHLRREIGRGMRQWVRVRNHSMLPWSGQVALALDADFADVQEVEGERQQQGRTTTTWDPEARLLSFIYRVAAGEHSLERGMRVRVGLGVEGGGAAAVTVSEERRLLFAVELPARGQWEVELAFESLVEGTWRLPQRYRGPDRAEGDESPPAASVDCPHVAVRTAFRRAAADLRALRNHELDLSDEAWVPNAGVPTYTGLFGRDSLTAAWQAALLGPQMMRGSLVRIAECQATADDPWRDAEPGKLVHEVRRGPLSELEIIPQRAYYGTHTTSAMFVVALSELWHWTGDLDFVARHKEVALRALEWARRHGDRDGDGFLEYVRRSPRGLKNHGWKDSDEAIRHPDGRVVDNPIATVEEQAYHYLALQRGAELLLALGDEAAADRLLEEARRLQQRWDQAYWVEEDGFYAMALDPEKRPVRSIGSNAGHALAAGLVPRRRARQVADRLLAPDLFSGWGVRTLSSAHPSYNPLGYHLGAVWPVENATFVLGFKRYGLDQHVDRLASGLFEAAGHFVGYRLPEAWTGDGPAEAPVPAPYPGANSPQAWSASATIQVVQMMLGLYPFAPAGLLALVRPRLPPWLPWLTVRDVRVGEAVVSLRFERGDDGTAHHQIIERSGSLMVVRAPPPDPVEGSGGGWLDEIKSWVLDKAPGRTARELRLALGHMGLGE